jgi:hypothetical protein
MYVDTQTELSDSQAVTATAISTNVIDLQAALGGGTNIANGNTLLDIGQGEDIYLVVATAVAITDTGSDATLTVTLESATDAGLTTGVVVHLATATLAFATYSAAGSQVLVAKLPVADYKRYLGVRYTVAAGPFLTGAFDAFITHDIQRAKIYKSAFTVQ